MKICIVTDTFYPDTNGVAVVLKNYVDGLVALGHEVVVIRSRRSKEHSDTLDETSYKQVLVYSVSLPSYEQVRLGIPVTPKVALVLERERFDVVYVATEWILGGIVANLARLKGVPVLSAYHTNLGQYMSHYGLGITRKAMNLYLSWFHNQSTAVIAHSEESAEQLKVIGVKRPVHVLAHGVDTELFSPRKRSNVLRVSWGAHEQMPVLLYVGRVAAEKNLQLFFKTLHALDVQGVTYKAVVVGEGPLLEEVRATYPAVHFTGALFGEDLATAYASADMFVFPSTTETFGNVTVEALASGLYVVGFDLAAVHQYVTTSVCGASVPVPNEDMFIQAICAHLTDWKYDAAHTEQRSQAVASISWPRITEQLVEVCTAVLQSSEDKTLLHREIDLSFFKEKLGVAVLKRFFEE